MVENKEFKIQSSTYGLILSIVLIGAQIGEVSLARKIISKLIDLEPKNPLAKITLSLVALGQNDYDLSFNILRDVCAEFPDNQMARALLASSMKMLGMQGWIPIAESVILDGSSPDAVNLACNILGRQDSGEQTSSAEQHAVVPPNAMWL